MTRRAQVELQGGEVRCQQSSTLRALVDRVRGELEAASRGMLLIRGAGGWKYREHVKLSDEELLRAAAATEKQLMRMCSRLLVAEDVIVMWNLGGHYAARLEDAQRLLDGKQTGPNRITA